MARQIENIIGEILTKQKKTLAIAESCTGGLVGSLVTDVSGSSVYFIGGVTAYSNQTKIELLKVPEQIIQEEGPVSRSCAVAMAQNIRKLLRTDIGVGLTGIAGPNGGTPEKPIGSVYIAVTDGQKTVCKLYRFTGDRIQIKQKASETALKMIRDLVLGEL